MRKLPFVFASGVLMTVASMIFGGCSPKGDRVAAEETAEQIENARIAGREAARTFVNRHWEDSLELQGHLIEAGAQRAKFDSVPRQQAAYDSAFISTVRTVQPDVAAQLERFSRNAR